MEELDKIWQALNVINFELGQVWGELTIIKWFMGGILGSIVYQIFMDRRRHK